MNVLCLFMGFHVRCCELKQELKSSLSWTWIPETRYLSSAAAVLGGTTRDDSLHCNDGRRVWHWGGLLQLVQLYRPLIAAPCSG